MNKLKLTGALVVVSMILSLLGNGVVFAATTKPFESSTSEAKIYSTATLDDNFDDQSVLVVLTNAASLANMEYGRENFSEINCKKN